MIHTSAPVINQIEYWIGWLNPMPYLYESYRVIHYWTFGFVPTCQNAVMANNGKIARVLFLLPQWILYLLLVVLRFMMLIVWAVPYFFIWFLDLFSQFFSSINWWWYENVYDPIYDAWTDLWNYWLGWRNWGLNFFFIIPGFLIWSMVLIVDFLYNALWLCIDFFWYFHNKFFAVFWGLFH